MGHGQHSTPSLKRAFLHFLSLKSQQGQGRPNTPEKARGKQARLFERTPGSARVFKSTRLPKPSAVTFTSFIFFFL